MKAAAEATSPLFLTADRLVTTVHDQDWYTVRNPHTSINSALGEPLIPNNSAGFSTMSRLAFFLLMFPPTQLADMVRLTNDELVRRGNTVQFVCMKKGALTLIK